MNCIAVGIDPAKNLIKKNYNKNVVRLIDFFNYKSSIKVERKFGKFDFILARNVLAHVKDPNEIFKGVNNIIQDNGIFVVEFPSLDNIFLLINMIIFFMNTLLSFIKSINDLCLLNKLSLINCEKIDSQGGSLRCYISSYKNNHKISPKKKQIINLENKIGLLVIKIFLILSIKLTIIENLKFF